MPIYAGGGVTGFVRLTLSIYNSAGTLQNATSLTCTLTLPDGTTTTLATVNDSAGLYHADYQPTQAGHYGVVWVASGTNAGVLEESFNVDDVAINAPLSLTDVKNHLNIDAASVSNDDELRAFILAATGLIEGQVGPITRRTVTDTLNGGRSTVILSTAPVASVTTVVENGSTLASSAYSLRGESGVLTRLFGQSEAVWAAGARNISVTYVAGRTDVPADLRHAVLETVRHLWTTQRGAVRRSGTDDYQPGAGFSLPFRVRELLSRYSQVL